MKKIYLVILALPLLMLGCKKDEGNLNPTKITTQSNKQGTQVLKVHVSGIKTIEGDIVFAVFDNSDDFADVTATAFRTIIRPVDSLKLTLVVDDMLPGTYAISLFHDKNKNGIMDVNFWGVPTEGFGFSNNAMGNFGPPSFEQASFKIEENQTTELFINLISF